MTQRQQASFKQDVIRLVASIPRGRVASYADVAERSGFPRRAARQVGWVLAQCDPGLKWYRVVREDGFLPHRPSGPPSEQASLLIAEGIEVEEGYRVDMEKYRWR